MHMGTLYILFEQKHQPPPKITPRRQPTNPSSLARWYPLDYYEHMKSTTDEVLRRRFWVLWQKYHYIHYRCLIMGFLRTFGPRWYLLRWSSDLVSSRHYPIARMSSLPLFLRPLIPQSQRVHLRNSPSSSALAAFLQHPMPQSSGKRN